MFRRGAGPQWDVLQAVGAISQAGNYDPVVFQDFHIIFGEDGNAVVITQSLREYELFGYDVVEDMGGLCFGGKFI